MLYRHSPDAAPETKQKRASFKPDFIAESVADIDFAALRDLGIQDLFIDLDGTVVQRAMYEVSDRFKQALQKSGMTIYIATNRPRSRDLKNLKDDLGAVGVIHPAGIFGKPTKRYFSAALGRYGLKRCEVVMIGDRYFQDIWGANRAGIRTLLVNKLHPPEDFLDRAFSRLEDKLTRWMSRGYH